MTEKSISSTEDSAILEKRRQQKVHPKEKETEKEETTSGPSTQKTETSRIKMLVTIDPPLHDRHSSRGQIQVIFGPMFSGKTTELMRRLKRYQIANHKVLIVKYKNDNRYDKESIATHDQQKMAAIVALELTSLEQEADNFSVIGIDEGQFFPDTASFAESMANKGKTVIVAALDGSYERKMFGDILSLVPKAESVIKLTAVCMLCFNEASYTKRIGDEKQLEVIGGVDKYMAVCRKCYFLETDDRQVRGLSVDTSGDIKKDAPMTHIQVTSPVRIDRKTASPHQGPTLVKLASSLCLQEKKQMVVETKVRGDLINPH